MGFNRCKMEDQRRQASAPIRCWTACSQPFAQGAAEARRIESARHIVRYRSVGQVGRQRIPRHLPPNPEA
jgi:hypothetical protein